MLNTHKVRGSPPQLFSMWPLGQRQDGSLSHMVPHVLHCFPQTKTRLQVFPASSSPVSEPETTKSSDRQISKKPDHPHFTTYFFPDPYTVLVQFLAPAPPISAQLLSAWVRLGWAQVCLCCSALHLLPTPAPQWRD